MKIVVCGIPPAQSRAMEHRFPEHQVTVIGAQESERRYIAHLTECDLCVVNVRLISHKVWNLIRQTSPGAVAVNGPSSAEQAIRDFINYRKEAA